MKKLFFALLVVLFATSAVAQTGLTCNDPIPVDENYEGTVTGACTRWYIANTYDLPLTVHFIPDNANSKLSPEIEVDFTCVPGVYADSKLDSLINLVDAYDVTFPLEMLCDQVIDENGKVEWDLSVNKNYREQLAEFGIPYNLQAFIKVKYYESGRITLKPDTLFKNCMENSEYLHLGDTIDIIANDVDRVFVLPYTDWQEDSIRFVWIGEQSATIYAAVQKCDFEPSVSNDYVKMIYTVSADSPKKLYSSEMKAAIKNNTGGGLFYGKVISGVSGKLVVEKIPLAAAQGGATLMEYGKPIQLEANDTNALFCFPRTWTATQFQSVSNFGITMYVSNTSDFTTAEGDVNTLNSFVAIAADNMRSIYLSNKEMEDLTKKSKDDYVYVRFRCASAVSITPDAWIASDCASGNSYLIVPNEAMSIEKNNTNIIYRLRYNDFVGYDLTMKWTGTGNITPYIADTCHYSLTTTSSRLVLSPAPTIKKRASYTVDSASLASWFSRVDADGYLYVRFSATTTGNLTFKTEKPVPADPEILTNECVESSIKVNVGDEFVLNLDSAFTVYCINYAELVNKNVTFRWAGEESLHTFIAETCQFAVAPYNKYVVNYIAIPASGELVLDAETLAKFADKVDDAGYLYVRFLTEKPGTITVQ